MKSRDLSPQQWAVQNRTDWYRKFVETDVRRTLRCPRCGKPFKTVDARVRHIVSKGHYASTANTQDDRA